jgi:hypothetical protein
MTKPEYILLREKKDGVVFSSMTVEVPKEFDRFIKDKNFTLRCSESSYSPETDILYKNKVYQTKQGFFLYLSLTEETMVIYYGEDQLNELTLFIRQLFKQLKNATNNDKRTEREN